MNLLILVILVNFVIFGVLVNFGQLSQFLGERRRGRATERATKAQLVPFWHVFFGSRR